MEINCKISISGLMGWVPPRGDHWPIIKHNTSSSLRLISVTLTFVRSLGLIFSGQQRCILERSETDNKDLGHIQSDKFWTETFGWIESRMPGGRMGTSLAALLSTSTSFPSKKAHSSLVTRVLWQVIHSLRENCNWEIMHAKYLKRGLYDNFLTYGENNWRPKLAAYFTLAAVLSYGYNLGARCNREVDCGKRVNVQSWSISEICTAAATQMVRATLREKWPIKIGDRLNVGLSCP